MNKYISRIGSSPTNLTLAPDCGMLHYPHSNFESENSMAISFDVLEAEIFKLSSADRSRLLDKLIATLDADPVVEDAWKVEARRRDEEIDSGKVQAIPGEVVLAGLRARLR
jgi:putative addiction module component (TIGR02574 family)